MRRIKSRKLRFRALCDAKNSKTTYLINRKSGQIILEPHCVRARYQRLKKKCQA